MLSFFFWLCLPLHPPLLLRSLSSFFFLFFSSPRFFHRGARLAFIVPALASTGKKKKTRKKEKEEEQESVFTSVGKSNGVRYKNLILRFSTSNFPVHLKSSSIYFFHLVRVFVTCLWCRNAVALIILVAQINNANGSRTQHLKKNKGWYPVPLSLLLLTSCIYTMPCSCFLLYS